MKTKTFSWEKKDTPDELHAMLEILGEDYPIIENGNAYAINFIKHDKGTKLVYNENQTVIYYDSITSAARGIGSALSGIGKDSGEISEELSFETLGIMIECSRNAILTVDYFKQWLRRLALMGCNIAMLYTKDAYELPGEDYFGYLRGRYTLDELREIDDYASKLGIEMIGCIQALGHLEPVLRWTAYAPLKDTSSVLLTSEEKSYELIDKMLDFFSKAFKSRRIHLGMDETHDLGRGRYMDQNGYRRGFDIYNDHLSKVSAKCEERGLSYMIWSDMFFRMGNKIQGYYEKDTVIPNDVKEKIPKDAQLVYWDYYHKDEEFYIDWIKRHKELGFPPVMASGIHTWKQLWHNYKQTKEAVTPCIEACLKENVKELFFTAWGDDGMSCDFDSAQAGLCYAVERCYSGQAFDEKNVAKRFETICGGNYDLHTKASEITDWKKDLSAMNLLWDDPIFGIYWKNQRASGTNFWERALQIYTEIEVYIKNEASANNATMRHITAVVEFLKRKIDFKLKLDAAFEEKDFDKLESLKVNISELIKSLDKLIGSFRTYWNDRFKRFGFEFIHIRLGGQRERFKELSMRIDELLKGRVNTIPELEEKAPFQKGIFSRFQELATASYFI